MEKWRDIEGYEGQYQVSDEGRVRGILRQRNGRSGKPVEIKGKDRKEITNEKGYRAVQLWKNNRGKVCKVHRLVAAAFLYNPDRLPEVDHVNKKRDDNRVENLRWSTVSDNRKRK